MALRHSRYACALLAFAASLALAQPETVNRPAAARRIVAQFDFEPSTREVFPIPQYWDLAQDGSKLTGPRPGFPAWNSAAFDKSDAFAGIQSLRLTTRGGSASLRLEPGVIPVFPGTDYLVSARIKTGKLNAARAGIRARFLDKASAVVPGSDSRSDLIRSDSGDWALVTVPLQGSFTSAAYIQVDLELLQPEQFETPGHAKHQVWPQDFAGSAWFDQVAVVQLPRAVISTSSANNIISFPDKPRITVALRDLTGEQITGVYTLQDASGAMIDTVTKDLGGGAGVWDWEPKISRLGWYRATLELRTDTRRVGAAFVDLAYLPPMRNAVPPDPAHFGVLLSDLPASQRAILPDLVAASGAGSVTVPVWARDSTPESIDSLCRDMVPMVERLRSAQVRLAFSFPELPAALAGETGLGADQVFSLFLADESKWSPYLTPLLDKYGQSVQRWQIGNLAPTAEPPTQAQLTRISSALAKLVPGPVIEVPWQADRQAPPFAGADHELKTMVPAGVSEGGAADLASSWLARPASGPAPPSRTLVLSTLPDAYTRLDSCTALVKQAVLLWAAADAPPLAIAQPWDWPSPWRAEGPMPHAELCAWANLSDRLRGRRSAGRLALRPGVSCIILADQQSRAPDAFGRKGCLVLWADTPGPVGSTLDLYLGDEPVNIVDIFGNVSSLAPVAQSRASAARTPLAHPLPIGEQPVFIENVDIDLAVFAASFKLDPAFAASTSGEHQLAMLLSNPWKDRVEGRITVLEPGGLSSDTGHRDRSWRITPRTSAFTIGPGETARTPILVAFSPVEEAGPRDFLVEIELSGAKDYAPIRLRSSLEIGVSDFHLDISYRIVNGKDVAVEAQLINRGKSGANYELSAFADGYPRGKAYVSELPAGAAATRRFSFPGGASKLLGQRVVVGVQDVSTQSRLTRSILVE